MPPGSLECAGGPAALPSCMDDLGGLHVLAPVLLVIQTQPHV